MWVKRYSNAIWHLRRQRCDASWREGRNLLVKSPNGGINETVHTRHHSGFAERACPRRGFRGVAPVGQRRSSRNTSRPGTNDPVFGSVERLSRTWPRTTPPGVNIGDPYTATDADEDALEFGDPDLQPRRTPRCRGVVRHRQVDRPAHHESGAGLMRCKTASYSVTVKV